MDGIKTDSILEQMIDTFYRTDVDGLLTLASPSVKNLLGYTVDEMLGTRLADYYVDREQRQDFLQKLGQENGKIVDYRAALRHKDGAIVWVSTNSSYFFNREGRVAGVEGVVRDISIQKQLEDELVIQNRLLEELVEVRTVSLVKINEQLKVEIEERRLAEETLQENVELLSQSQEIAHIGSWHLDLIKNQLTWSDEVYRIFGLKPLEFQATYEAFLERVHPEDRAEVDAAFSDSLQYGQNSYEIDHRIIRKHTGEIRYVHERCSHFLDDGGTVIRSIGMVYDITEHKLAEIRLNDKTVLLDNILRNANQMAIVTTDLDFHITYYNPMAERLFGYTAKEVIGKTVQEIHLQENVSPDRFERAIEMVHQAGEYRYCLEKEGEGGRHHIESRVAGIYSLLGEQTGYSLFSKDITLEKENEKIIAGKEKLFRDLFESISDALFIHTLDGKILRVNKTACKRLGYSEEELLTMTPKEFTLLENQKLFLQRGRTLKDQGEILFETTHICKNGQQIPTEINARLIQYDGKTASFSVARDITARKTYEKNLQKLNDELETRVAEQVRNIQHQEQALQSVFRAAPVGIGVVQDRILTQVNPMVEQITGYREEELLGQSARMLYADDAEFRFVGEEKYRQIQKQGTGTVETRWQCKKGNFIDVLLSSTPIDLQDLAVGVTFTVLDISQRKKTEKELSAAYRELDQVFNAAVPLCLVSEGCRIARINQAFCDYFRVSKEEIIDTTGVDFWGCDLFGSDDCALNRLQKDEDSCHRQLDKNINGKQFCCSIHSVPYYDTAGHFVGMVSSFFDMTAHKMAQDALVESQRQLRQAEKLSAIGTLVGSIAHEFNNPLCGVMNVLHRIDRNGVSEEKDAPLLQMAQAECERMKKMIQDLQDFNRPSDDRKSDFDLHGAIDDLLHFFKKEFLERKALIIRQYSSRPVILNGIKDQIRQVLLNLIKNGVDALGAEGGTITIHTWHRNQDLMISIHDSGEGIAPADMQHIFEPFFTTKSAVKGTGLGLSVSHGIIESHNGKLEVESEPGQGTTFTLLLPINNDISSVKEQK